MLDQITPIILTYNEEPNISRTLDALAFAKRIVVVDSFSTDATLDLVRRREGTVILQHPFQTFADQWNYVLGHEAVQTDWVMPLDADYVFTPELVAEIAALRPPPDVVGYEIRFRYCVGGKPLRGSLYPARVNLFRRGKGRFTRDGHSQRLHLDEGRVERLAHYIDHDDRKPFTRWMQAQGLYAAEEARKLASTRWSELSWPDRVRKVPLLSTPIVMGYCLAWKGCALDGRAGLIYTSQRMLAELAISIELLQTLSGGGDDP